MIGIATRFSARRTLRSPLATKWGFRRAAAHDGACRV